MRKFKYGLVKEIKEEKRKELVQKKLHQKYQVPNKDVVIVEKKNLCKFFIRVAAGGIRVTSMLILLGLATTGTLAFLYPQIRTELLQILAEIWNDVCQLLP